MMSPCALMGVSRGPQALHSGEAWQAGSSGRQPPSSSAKAQRGPFHEATAPTRLFGRTASHHGMEATGPFLLVWPQGLSEAYVGNAQHVPGARWTLSMPSRPPPASHPSFSFVSWL